MRILIVDDSAITRGIFEKAFKQNGFEVAGLLSNGRKAVDFCRTTRVDVVLCDTDMSEMDGFEATKIIAKEIGIPVVLYAENAAEKAKALDAGASLFLQKPSLSSYNGATLKEFAEKLRESVGKPTLSSFSSLSSGIRTEGASLSSAKSADTALPAEGFKILCIGASTGGPSAVQEVLLGLGENFPLPVLYAQHLDVGADEKMAKWFDDTCPNITVTLAKDGEVAQAGHVYLAPANTHLVIDYVKNGVPVLKLSDEPPERFLKPAVNKLFRSAAKHYKTTCLAVLMTGMGRDGAEGCKEIVDAGGYTIAEDKSTCTVFGMPAAAIELNAAKKVLPRGEIAKAVLQLVR